MVSSVHRAGLGNGSLPSLTRYYNPKLLQLVLSCGGVNAVTPPNCLQQTVDGLATGNEVETISLHRVAAIN